MKKLLKYSVLRYSPSKISGESINLGIILCDDSCAYKEFRYTKKFSRLASFDDEVNIDLVKILLKNIKEDVEGTLLLKQSFDIDEYTKYYINDFCFEKPKSIEYSNLEETVELLHKSYFRFEYSKEERPTKSDEIKLIERLLKTQKKQIEKNKIVFGASKEPIRYDFVTEEYFIKFFDFDNKNLKYSISSAKSWAWNSLHSDAKKIMIIYRCSEEVQKESESFKIIEDIFSKSNALFCSLDSAANRLVG